MKCLFVYNPVSGRGKVKKKLNYIVQKLSEKYSVVDVYETKCSGELATVVKNACGKYDAFIFSGGDGTVNEVINGVAEQQNKPILGYIPTGTVNDVARSFKIKRSIKGALNNVLNGSIESFDVMKLNDRYGFYAVACGTMTSCSYMTGQKEKNKVGKIAYGFYALKHDFRFDRFEVEYSYNDKELQKAQATLILIINSRSVSTLKVNRGAALNDGLVDVVIVSDNKNKEKWNFLSRVKIMFKTAFLFLFGFKRYQKNRNNIAFSTSKATFKISEETCWNFDGEKGVKGELNLSVLQNEVKFIVPKGKNK